MKLGSLFSGGGLGDFGFMAAGFDIRWQVEIDPYCQNILSLRYPDSKKYTDIKTLKGADIEPIDILTGGFPCQPFSVAGKQKGKEDNRYLWPEMLRIIKECGPRWIVGENVPGIINMALDTVCTDLEAEGYEVWPVVFPSHALGAWHKRDRLWIICHSSSNGWNNADEVSRRPQQGSVKRGREEGKIEARELKGSSSGIIRDASLANSKGVRAQGRIFEQGREPVISQLSENTSNTTDTGTQGVYKREINPFKSWWDFEPSVGRVANGIADRIHRLKMLGNGQVPACTYVIGKMIMDIEKGYL